MPGTCVGKELRLFVQLRAPMPMRLYSRILKTPDYLGVTPDLEVGQISCDLLPFSLLLRVLPLAGFSILGFFPRFFSRVIVDIKLSGQFPPLDLNFFPSGEIS